MKCNVNKFHLVTERADYDLQILVNQQTITKKVFTFNFVVEIVSQITDELCALHKCGITLDDLKLTKILLCGVGIIIKV